MAKNDDTSFITNWPPEGLPRDDAAVRFTGGEARRDAWQQARAVCPSRARQLASINTRPLSDQEEAALKAARRAREAFYAPLIAAVNSGVLVAMGRPNKDAFSYLLIPPPLPSNWGFIRDLRFWPRELAPQPSPPPIRYVGPLETINAKPVSKEPAYYADIRRAADELFPDGYKNERPTNVNAFLDLADRQISAQRQARSTSPRGCEFPGMYG